MRITPDFDATKRGLNFLELLVVNNNMNIFLLRLISVWILSTRSIFASNGTTNRTPTADDDNLNWWKTAVLYQIYPRSIKDSNGDGIGDLNGVASKIDHFHDARITTVWFSPIYTSPMVDLGYDISNFKEISPIFGTMEDFISLLKLFHSKGIRVLLDFVPNHTSDQHEWFQKSKNRTEPYTDYYVWRDGVDGKPPNNWISVFQGSAWEFVPERGQYYFHQFASAEPDLNFQNPKVLEEMKNVLKFWLDKGIDGFRIDSANFIIEDPRFLDEPVIRNSSNCSNNVTYDDLDHIYTKNQEGNHAVMAAFRTVTDEYTAKNKETKVLIAEVYANFTETIKYYDEVNYPFNFDFITVINASSNAHDYSRSIQRWLNLRSKGRVPNWVLGNHDNSRPVSRFKSFSFGQALYLMTLCLPGAQIIYYGDECGMWDTYTRYDQTVDIQALQAGPEHYQEYTRDPERSPFQWDSSRNAGFSDANTTWLPVNSNYWYLNLKNQIGEKRSFYNEIKKAIKLHQSYHFKNADVQLFVPSNWILYITRSLNNVTFIICINIGSDTYNVTVDTPQKEKEMKVYISTINSEYVEGDIIKTDKSFPMRPKSLIVVGPKSTATFSGN